MGNRFPEGIGLFTTLCGCDKIALNFVRMGYAQLILPFWEGVFLLDVP